MKSYLSKVLTAGLATAMFVGGAIAVVPGVLAQTDNGTSTTPDQNQTQTPNQYQNPGGGTTIVPVPVQTGPGLGQLFIYDQLFNRSSGTLPGVRARNLGDLYVLSQLFGGNGGLNMGGYSTLGLGGLSGNLGYGLGSNGNLGNLFVLDRLFGNTTGHSSVFSGSSGNLGDYMILNQLFR